MSGLTILEQMCGLTMLLAGMGAILLLYAGLALERQRRVMLALHQHAMRLTYRTQHNERRLILAQNLILALAVETGGVA